MYPLSVRPFYTMPHPEDPVCFILIIFCVHDIKPSLIRIGYSLWISFFPSLIHTFFIFKLLFLYLLIYRDILTLMMYLSVVKKSLLVLNVYMITIY